MDITRLILIMQYITMLSAGAIVLLALMGWMLYRRAYKEMKRSRIIGSLAFLLLAIAIKFAVVLLAFVWVWAGNINLETFNATNLIPNIILIWAIFRFIYISVETPKEAKDCLSEVDKKDIRKI